MKNKKKLSLLNLIIGVMVLTLVIANVGLLAQSTGKNGATGSGGASVTGGTGETGGTSGTGETGGTTGSTEGTGTTETAAAEKGKKAPERVNAPNPLLQFLPLIAIFVIFYLIIFMPARKKQKQHQAMISNLQGGERVVTSGGIYGTIKRVMDDRFEIEVSKGVTMQFAKGYIAGIIDLDAGQTSSKE